jgi:hypothetical protein
MIDLLTSTIGSFVPIIVAVVAGIFAVKTGKIQFMSNKDIDCIKNIIHVIENRLKAIEDFHNEEYDVKTFSRLVMHIKAHHSGSTECTEARHIIQFIANKFDWHIIKILSLDFTASNVNTIRKEIIEFFDKSVEVISDNELNEIFVRHYEDYISNMTIILFSIDNHHRARVMKLSNVFINELLIDIVKLSNERYNNKKAVYNDR